MLLFASCTAELEESTLVRETLNVSFDPETRIQLNESQKTVWNKGDQVSVYNYSNANERWDFKGETGSRSGIIQRYDILAGSPIDRIIIAYPYRSDYVLNTAESSISTVFSARQTYAEGSYGIGENIMISSGTSTDFVLRNVFGLLKIQLVGTGCIKEIMLYDNNREQLNGSIDVNYETLGVTFSEITTSPGSESGDGDVSGSMVDNITLTLDCGEEGVALNPATSTAFYIAVLPRTFKNGFTIKVTGTDGTTMEKSTANEVVIERNRIKPFAELQFNEGEGGEVGYTNLSANGTANSYIVYEAGDYKFSTVQGNSSTSVGAVAVAEVLWETFGTNVTPNVGDLVSDVTYSDGYISFKASDKKGNASIAAKDGSGKILWSWHIWMTDKPEDQVYKNNAGTMMDRNLGATSATPGDVGALGLLYQWGRKDPFLGSSSISSNSRAKSTLNSWSTIESTASEGTIAYAITHPTSFFYYNSSNHDWYYTGDNNTDNTRWQSYKTVYDPCPIGYRVPDGGISGIWSIAFGTSEDFEWNLYDSVKKGFNFGKNETKYLTEDLSCWYPTAGILDAYLGTPFAVNTFGVYWSCSPYYNSAYYLIFDVSGYIEPSAFGNRSEAASVRCLKE